jgi:hypothetical protein
MAQPFYERLRTYYESLGAVLRGEAAASSVFANSGDVGTSRERAFAQLLKEHAPVNCNVFLGGFLFHFDGRESGQLDVIVTSSAALRFDFHNRDGGGKSFAPVEGTIAVASIKSTLDKQQLIDALENISSIPPTMSLNDRVMFGVEVPRYDEWPYKIIFAKDGLEGKTILRHLEEYYVDHPDIPLGRRPNIIYVAGKYFILSGGRGLTFRNAAGEEEETDIEPYYLVKRAPDFMAVAWMMNAIQGHAAAATHIQFDYGPFLNGILSNLQGRS